MSGVLQDKWHGRKEATLEIKQLSGIRHVIFVKNLPKLYGLVPNIGLTVSCYLLHRYGSFNLILLNIQLRNPAQSEAFC